MGYYTYGKRNAPRKPAAPKGKLHSKVFDFDKKAEATEYASSVGGRVEPLFGNKGFRVEWYD